MSLVDPRAGTPRSEPSGRAVRAAIWLPGLAVAIGAAVATAHGLFEVALAARVPAGIAWLYPLITDGLALVAYTATARLQGGPARYAWSVVVLAAGLSGLAQAAYLAGDAAVAAPPLLRFGVGAWPAVAAAIVAHLLFLLAVESSAVDAEPVFSVRGVQPDRPAVQQPTSSPVQPELTAPVQQVAVQPAANSAVSPVDEPDSGAERTAPAPARERARAAAEQHAHRHGALPTVTELEAAAEVSRGTAATVLKALRAQPAPLQLVTRRADDPGQDDDPTIEERTQP